jgi:hypothetical protein
MKKLLLVLFTAFMVVGCDNNNSEPFGYSFIEIDSCEYIRGIYQLTHKGNCRFCKERRQKEQKELVEQLKEK